MNEDYLWDGSGSDPEIEALEKGLSVFRISDSKPPQVTAGVSTRERVPFFGFLRLRPAAAFVSVLFLLAAGFFVSRYPVAGVPNVAIAFGDESSAESPTEIPEGPSLDSVAEPQVETARNFAKPERAHGRRVARAASADTVKREPDGLITAALTPEERHAYDQLMLALSITSSSLKHVQDRVNGGEGEEVILPKTSSFTRSN